MEDNEILLSQDELDRVLNGVRSDNEENDTAIVGQKSAAISQAELDLLLGSSNSTMKKIEPKQEESVEKETVPPEPEVDVAVPESKPMTMEEKIAARKARAAELLAKVNAASPKRISVVYGSTLTTGTEIEKYKPGTLIELDRPRGADVDILCDGKLIGRGIVGCANGKTVVKITSILE